MRIGNKEVTISFGMDVDETAICLNLTKFHKPFWYQGLTFQANVYFLWWWVSFEIEDLTWRREYE